MGSAKPGAGVGGARGVSRAPEPGGPCCPGLHTCGMAGAELCLLLCIDSTLVTLFYYVLFENFEVHTVKAVMCKVCSVPERIPELLVRPWGLAPSGGGV